MRKIITLDNVARYLLDNGLLDAKSIVNGDVQFIDISSRNKNIKVLRESENSGYILKQSRFSEPYGAESLRNEAKLYSLVQEDPDFANLRKIVPNMIRFDAQEDIIILEFTDGLSLREYIQSRSKGELPIHVFALLGKLMGTYHRAFGNIDESGKASLFPRLYLPTLIVSKPGIEIFREVSPANLQLLGLIQKYPDLNSFLTNLESEWLPQTLIHGDIKWDNLSISEKNNANRPIDIKIVDWEIADIGDPAWDIGEIIREFIGFWLSSLPEKEDTSKLIGKTSHILRNIGDAMRAFWNSYTAASDIKDDKANVLLTRSIKYSAAQLIQLAYDSQHWQSHISHRVIRTLQVCQNIMHDVDSAAISLLGVPIRGQVGTKNSSMIKEIKSLIESIVINSPTNYNFQGKTFSVNSTDRQPVTSSTGKKNALVLHLADILYQSIHCRHTGVVHPLFYDYSTLYDFTEALSRANVGHGTWQPGWVITEIRGEELKVQKDGITLWVAARQFTSPDQYLEVGKKGHIWMLKEWRELLPGYYTALGNESDDFEGKVPVVRLYFNVESSGALELTHVVTSELNSVRIPFKFKVLNNPEGFTRADAACFIH